VTKRLTSSLIILTLLSACVLTGPAPAPVSQAEWWQNAVFYEIFVRSFYDTDEDGIGDFNGITQKLDYLQELGITAIWLMPIHPSPSYHGYDVLNYYNVNPEYGTMADFKRLLDEAHQRDMRIIIDLVINHTSSQHPFFIAADSDPTSPYRDWYIWSETDPGNGWHMGNSGYYYGFFWEGMPDLNFPQSRSDGVHGKRGFLLARRGRRGRFPRGCRQTSHRRRRPAREHPGNPRVVSEDSIVHTKNKFPDAYTVGEVFGAGSSVVKSYTGDQLDQVFNFEMSTGMVNGANAGASSGINSAIQFALADMPDFNFATFLTNHDQNRVMSVLNGNVDKAKVAASLLLTSPGTPFIYYGEEIGMQGRKPDEDIRLPMQWSGERMPGLAVAGPGGVPKRAIRR
jgi:alpha-amylase